MRASSLKSLWPLFFPVIVLMAPAYALPNDHFVEYFSGYSGLFEGFAENNCTEILEQYRNNSRPGCADPNRFTQCVSGPAVECLYEGLSETQKNNLGAAGIMLGLLPTILAMSGTTIIDSGLLSMRRPLLALLLTVGAPVVVPVRMIDLAYKAMEVGEKPIRYGGDVFSTKRVVGKSEHRPMRQRLLVLGIFSLQYLIVIGAGVHTLYTSIELGVKGACSFSTNSTFLPLVWAVAGIPIHVVGAVVMRLRFTHEDKDGGSWWNRELTPCIIRQDKLSLKPRGKSVSIPFVILSWVIMITTIIHVLFGTLVLSSTMFVNTADALWLALRYLASTMLCRVVMAFEVDGLAGKKPSYERVSQQVDPESGASQAEAQNSTKG